jgi:hypothetical protein
MDALILPAGATKAGLGKDQTPPLFVVNAENRSRALAAATSLRISFSLVHSEEMRNEDRYRMELPV